MDNYPISEPRATSAPVDPSIGRERRIQRDRRVPRRFMDPFVPSSSLVSGVQMPSASRASQGKTLPGSTLTDGRGGGNAPMRRAGALGINLRDSHLRELKRAKEEADMLKHRVQVLARSERILKQKLAERREALKDVMTELQGTRTELILAEEKITDLGAHLQLTRREFEKYRGWWLTEYYSLKVVLELVSRRDNVEEIASSSRARFIAHSERS